MLEHAMKVVERIFEHRIWQQIVIDDMLFGFMKGKGTTDAIFMARQMQENFRVKGKKLYFVVDLEKAFDRVPREVISWAMRNLKFLSCVAAGKWWVLHKSHLEKAQQNNAFPDVRELHADVHCEH